MSAPEVVDDSAPVERYDENTEAGVNPNTSGENVSEDRVQGDDLDGISKDNIIEGGERSARPTKFTQDEELDKAVDQVAEADPGMK